MLEETFWRRILTSVFNMKIVTRRSRGFARSVAISFFRGAGDDSKLLTFEEGSENKAISEAEKNPDQKVKKANAAR